ncbi:MAG TPA: sigma-54 dependent transcriptional regulator [Myxococcota bacterium]|jgi:DNA-binding NtrC family response regulator|nr:sigma-54 dependent transcriptional regulator [Myxococcota bacterium]
MPNPLSALVVDDDREFRESVALIVEREGFTVREADCLAAARARLGEVPADIVLIDLSLPDGDGLELAHEDAAAPSAFVVITGNASLDSAVDSLRRGALDYLSKPVDRARLRSILAHVSRQSALRAEVSSLRGELRELGRFGALIGRSKPMQEVYDLIGRVAPTDASVLILGESGTGKELVAQTIHTLSRRRDASFVAVNCGAISPSLIESELFGHEKGSFTGADRRRHGFFEQANGGTLFLDEITEMPLELQVKLLRVLEMRAVTRVGSTDSIPVDVRLVSASNRNPTQAVESGSLRQDLLFRLNVFPIHLPPLRDRGDDIELLAEHFLAHVNRREKSEKRWSDAALRHLRDLPWSGNVRELRNAVDRAAILTDRVIGVQDLPALQGRPALSGAPGSLQVEVGSTIADVERSLILATLEHLGGDKKRAAEVLGISLKTLYNRLAVYSAAARGGV